MSQSGDARVELIEHASCVAVGEAGALILGRSGAGKSRLALKLIALGATLVADDRVVLRRDGAVIYASPPKPLEGLVEARGIGLLQTEFTEVAALRLVIDLDAVEPDRLPPVRERSILGVSLPAVLCKDMPDAAAALFVLLKSGGARRAP